MPPVILVLPCCVPQAQGDWSPVDHEWCGVGVEDGGDVLAGEGVGGVADEETGLAHGAVPHHHALDGLHGGAHAQAAADSLSLSQASAIGNDCCVSIVIERIE